MDVRANKVRVNNLVDSFKIGLYVKATLFFLMKNECIVSLSLAWL